MNELKHHPIIQMYIANNHFGELLGMDFSLMTPGVIDYRMKVEQRHLATPIAAHGGSVCSLMDATMGVCALSEVIHNDKVVSTIEMKISFVAPALEGDELIGTAKIVKSGQRLLFVEGTIRNQDDKLIASASGTFNAYPIAKAGFQI